MNPTNPQTQRGEPSSAATADSDAADPAAAIGGGLHARARSMSLTDAEAYVSASTSASRAPPFLPPVSPSRVLAYRHDYADDVPMSPISPVAPGAPTYATTVAALQRHASAPAPYNHYDAEGVTGAGDGAPATWVSFVREHADTLMVDSAPHRTFTRMIRDELLRESDAYHLGYGVASLLHKWNDAGYELGENTPRVELRTADLRSTSIGVGGMRYTETLVQRTYADVRAAAAAAAAASASASGSGSAASGTPSNEGARALAALGVLGGLGGMGSHWASSGSPGDASGGSGSSGGPAAYPPLDRSDDYAKGKAFDARYDWTHSPRTRGAAGKWGIHRAERAFVARCACWEHNVALAVVVAESFSDRRLTRASLDAWIEAVHWRALYRALAADMGSPDLLDDNACGHVPDDVPVRLLSSSDVMRRAAYRSHPNGLAQAPNMPAAADDNGDRARTGDKGAAGSSKASGTGASVGAGVSVKAPRASVGTGTGTASPLASSPSPPPLSSSSVSSEDDTSPDVPFQLRHLPSDWAVVLAANKRYVPDLPSHAVPPRGMRAPPLPEEIDLDAALTQDDLEYMTNTGSVPSARSSPRAVAALANTHTDDDTLLAELQLASGERTPPSIILCHPRLRPHPPGSVSWYDLGPGADDVSAAARTLLRLDEHATAARALVRAVALAASTAEAGQGRIVVALAGTRVARAVAVDHGVVALELARSVSDDSGEDSGDARGCSRGWGGYDSDASVDSVATLASARGWAPPPPSPKPLRLASILDLRALLAEPELYDRVPHDLLAPHPNDKGVDAAALLLDTCGWAGTARGLANIRPNVPPTPTPSAPPSTPAPAPNYAASISSLRELATSLGGRAHGLRVNVPGAGAGSTGTQSPSTPGTPQSGVPPLSARSVSGRSYAASVAASVVSPPTPVNPGPPACTHSPCVRDVAARAQPCIASVRRLYDALAASVLSLGDRPRDMCLANGGPIGAPRGPRSDEVRRVARAARAARRVKRQRSNASGLGLATDPGTDTEVEGSGVRGGSGGDAPRGRPSNRTHSRSRRQSASSATSTGSSATEMSGTLPPKSTLTPERSAGSGRSRSRHAPLSNFVSWLKKTRRSPMSTPGGGPVPLPDDAPRERERERSVPLRRQSASGASTPLMIPTRASLAPPSLTLTDLTTSPTLMISGLAPAGRSGTATPTAVPGDKKAAAVGASGGREETAETEADAAPGPEYETVLRALEAARVVVVGVHPAFMDVLVREVAGV